MAEAENKQGNVTLKQIFQKIDKDGSGHLSRSELTTALQEANISLGVIEQILAEADQDEDDHITEKEFLEAMRKANEKNGKVGELSNLVKAQAALLQVSFNSGGVHTYSTEELNAFAEHINAVLGADPDLQNHLPIELESEDLFTKVADGLILGKFVNLIKPDALDTRALNYPKGEKGMSVFKINENLNLVINATKSLGVAVINVGCTDIREVKNPSMILGLLWQMVKLHLLSDLNLKAHPELLRLLREGESMEDFLKLKPEDILKRWLNYHLENAESDIRVNNFSSDVKNSEAYAIVMEQVAPPKQKESVDKNNILSKKKNVARAEQSLTHSRILGCNPFVKAKDIALGNPKLNLAFVADLFNHCPGLEEYDEEELKDKFGLDDDPQGERTELAFRCWANNLNIEDFFLHNLFDGMMDGLSLLKIIDAVEPGIVNWKKVQMKPKMVFHKNGNNSYGISLLKGLQKHGVKFSLVGIGGQNVTDGHKMYILAIMWQLFRYHSIKFLAELAADGEQISDAKILAMANDCVVSVGGTAIPKFNSADGADGVWACNLVKSIDPEVFDDDFVTDDARLNARYAISVARRHGCMVFLLPDDIIECNKKLILVFAAAVLTKRGKLQA